ncbi:MAG: reductive dehalogenase [Chloroflexota bacterium]
MPKNLQNPTNRRNLSKGEESDQEAGFEILDDFERFHQKNEMFRRSQWDARVRSEKTDRFYSTHSQPLSNWRGTAGFKQQDYALRNAAWHISDVLTDVNAAEGRREGFTDVFTPQVDIAVQEVELGTPEQAAEMIKRAAKLFGAGSVGITALDERWQYETRFSDIEGVEKAPEISEALEHVIVVAIPMDYELMKTVPSALGSAATGLGYSHDATLLITLTQYIRGLGFQAIGSLNDTALSIPYAIKAGLGEFGRNGLLITKEFGPRVRLGKVFTNMPLAHDRPIQFGVRKFCEICKRCALTCPSKSISLDGPSATPLSQSNIKGARKWVVDVEKCFAFWGAQNSDCAVCIRACPYNKDYRHWWHRAARRLAGTRLRKLILSLDALMRYGVRAHPKHWWQRSKY